MLQINCFSKDMLDVMSQQWAEMAVLAIEFKDTFQRAYQQFEQEITENANDGSQWQIKATKTLLMKKKVDLTWEFWMQHR